MAAHRGKSVALTAVLAASVWIGPGLAAERAAAQEEPEAAGACSPNAVRFKTQTAEVITTSTDFVNVPRTAVTIEVGSPGPSCVIVTFSAAALGNGTSMGVRAVIPQLSAVAEPPFVRFAQPGSGWINAHSMQFVFPSVSPGTRTIHIQFARGTNPGTARLYERTVTVQYVK